jgi:hypothetical protein
MKTRQVSHRPAEIAPRSYVPVGLSSLGKGSVVRVVTRDFASAPSRLLTIVALRART